MIRGLLQIQMFCLSLLLMSACGLTAPSGTSDDDKTEAKDDGGTRPTEDVEGLPGYLRNVSKIRVLYDEGTSFLTVEAEPKTVECAACESPEALFVHILSAADNGAVTVLGVTRAASDGSFFVTISDVEQFDKITVAISDSADTQFGGLPADEDSSTDTAATVGVDVTKADPKGDGGSDNTDGGSGDGGTSDGSEEDQPIPAVTLPESATKGGLRGDYYAGANLEGDILLTRLDIGATSQEEDVFGFYWAPGQSPHEDVPTDAYSIRWTGFMMAPEAGEYKIILGKRGGFRFWLGDTLIDERWLDNEEIPGQTNVKVKLEKGAIPVKIEFFNSYDSGQISFHWRIPSTFDEVRGLSKDDLYGDL